MDGGKAGEKTECLRKFGNFHDCQIMNMDLNFKDECIEFVLSNVLWGVYGTEAYVPGPGKIRFSDVDEVSLSGVCIDDDYIYSVKIRDGGECNCAEMVIGNGRVIQFSFQDLEVWKEGSRLA